MARKIAEDAIPDGWKYGSLDNFAVRCSIGMICGDRGDAGKEE